MSSDLPTATDPSLQDEGLPVATSSVPSQFAREPYSADPGVDWRRYLAALWRYKWWIVLITILGTAAGVLAARYVTGPEYEAQATIWIQATSGAQSNRRGPIQSSELLQSFAWVDLLRSYLVLDSVVVEQQLFLKADVADRAGLAGFGLKPRFRPGKYRFDVGPEGASFELRSDDGRYLGSGSRGDSVGPDLGFIWLPNANAFSPHRTIEFTVGIPRDAATRLAGDLGARMVQKGNFLRLSLSGSEPERTASILNAIANRYTQVAAQLKDEKLRQIAAILNEQLDYAERRLVAVEGALEGFRVQTITLPAERASPITPGLEVTRDPAFANFFNLKIEQDELRREREAIERILDQAPDSGLSVAGLEFVSAQRGSSGLSDALRELTERRAELRALRLTYTGEHPLVRSALAEIEVLEQRTIPGLARRLVAEFSARESELESMIASASSELSRIPPRAIEEAGLQRRVEIAANFYTELQLRHEEALLAAANAIPDVRILDPAIAPQRPVNERDGPLLILMAFVGSLGLGAAGAMLLDSIDSRLRYPEQVGLDLGLPILGTVPHVAGRDAGDTAQVVEAFRLIRLNVLHAHGTAGPVVIAITSPGREEGKSFVAVNLGLAFAELGRRALLIDGDVRRGRMHHLLGATRKPGLTDYLAGEVPRARVVQATFRDSLDCIGSGSRRRNAPELLQSSAMAALVAELRPSYDVIIVDAPPVGVGADALALGMLTGNVVIVLRTGATDRDLTEVKLDMLERLPIRILGAVLNDVPASRAYYYYRYRYDAYLPGYEARDEEGVGHVPARIESVSAPVEAGEVEAGESEPLAVRSPDTPDPNPVPEGAPEAQQERSNPGPPEPDGDDFQELHRRHQRRSQLRQWR